MYQPDQAHEMAMVAAEAMAKKHSGLWARLFGPGPDVVGRDIAHAYAVALVSLEALVGG